MKKTIRKLIIKALDTRGLVLVSKRFNGNLNLKADSIPGWFTPVESEKLYRLIMVTSGSILEIGHFLGRSTACICEALKDSKNERIFNSYDLGFISPDEFKNFYDNLHQRDTPVPPLYLQLYSSKMKSTDVARSNLNNVGLDNYVNLVSGDFIELDHEHYDFIFCDAMHEPHEIEHNLPEIIKRSSRHCVWAFHDMTDGNIDLILRLSNSRFVEKAHSLGVFVYLGNS